MLHGAARRRTLPSAMQLFGLWLQGFQIRHHGLRILSGHPELRHWRTQGPPIAPNAGRQELHHLRIGSGRVSGNSRCLQRPIFDRLCRPQPNCGSFQPVRTIGIVSGIPRRVALPADRDPFHDVFPSSHRSLATVTCRFTRLPRHLPNSESTQADGDEGRGEKRATFAIHAFYHPTCIG